MTAERPIISTLVDAVPDTERQTARTVESPKIPKPEQSTPLSAASPLQIRTLANPLESPIDIVDRSPHQLPFDPFNAAVNARRAEILAEKEAGPLSRFSGFLADIQGSRRFEGYVKDYTTVLGIGGVSPHDIRRFKIRADKSYKRESSSVVRARMVRDMKGNLELLIEDRFDTDLNAVAALKIDAGIDQITVQQDSLDAAREFKPAKREGTEGRKGKIEILRSLAAERRALLISNYETYLRLWQDLNPDGVNIEVMRSGFEMAGPNRARQLALAEKLYVDVSNAINQRALAYTAQRKQLSVDQGLPPEMAEEEAHLQARDATTGPLVARMVKMQEIRGMTEELLLKTFGISSRLWAEMTTGSLETQFDLDAGFDSRLMSVENRIKFAKGLYRKIDKRLKADSTRLFTRLAVLLREKGKLGEFDITLKINRRQEQLKSLPRPEQYKRIQEWSRALGLKPEVAPATKAS